MESASEQGSRRNRIPYSIEELLELMQLEAGYNENSDGYITESYVPWPDPKEYDRGLVEHFLECLGIRIPFGEPESIEGLAQAVTGLDCRYDFEVISNVDVEEGEVSFRSFEDLRSDLDEILRNVEGLPTGTVYEWDMSDDYPDWVRYHTRKFNPDDC